MRILKGTRGYFEVPAVKTLPPGSWKGTGHSPTDPKTGPRTARCKPAESPAPEKPAHTALLEPAETNRSREIHAALDAAFDLKSGYRQQLQVTREEIEAALEAVFPQNLCTLPPVRKVEPRAEQDVFEISYERELNCLMNEGLIDRQWLPAGMLWFSDRPETR